MSKIIKFALVVNFILILFILNARAADQVYFYHTDPVGTPMAISDANGQVVWRGDYKPFGEEASVSGALTNDRKFVGKEKDEETGLYYFGARYMDAKIGRFAAVDPVRAVDSHSSKANEESLLTPQGLNAYAYSINNPYRYVDQDGRIFERIWNNKTERGGHKTNAITMREFIKYTHGKSLKDVQHEVDMGSKGARSAGGPDYHYRYVLNPNNSKEVIDMRHFIVVGQQGELAGLAIEIAQKMGGDKASAFDAQDLLSNKLGKYFIKGYNSKQPLDYQLNKHFYGVIECKKE